MASRPWSPEELLRAMEHHHEQYLKTLRAFQEAVHQTAAPPPNPAVAGIRMERAGSSGEGSVPGSPVIRTPPPSSSSLPGLGLGLTSRPTFTSDTASLHVIPLQRRGRRLTNEAGLVDGRGLSGLVGGAEDLYDSESDDDDDLDFPFVPPAPFPPRSVPDDRVSATQEPLAPCAYTDDQLVKHLKGLGDDVPEATAAALGEIWRRRGELTPGNLFVTPDSASADEDLYESATYEVYDVGRDALAAPRHDASNNDDSVVLDPSTVWDTVKAVNMDGKAVGRMTILQEPSPLMLGAVHMAMSQHFDMDELFQHLVTTKGNHGKTRAFVHRAFEATSVRRRSFFFAFKYHTVVGEGLTPAPWQQYDHRPIENKSPDHIHITECSSILALSLGGEPTKQIQARSRRRRALQEGFVHDTFAPWHLLSIQCFPDLEHSMRSEDAHKPFYSGPYAFLDSLAAEYRDAVKRYLKINEMISKLTTPPNQFMFDGRLRDKLLFEDKDFTYSRRYFWGYNTLGVINDGIKAMVAAYAETFNADFWAGRHGTLWPHPDPESPEGRNYLRRMGGLRHELERAIKELRTVSLRNEAVRQEIMSLREQLFSGSSVKESRRAIEQGDNIKVLTGVSMIFLPLTFVTSVFGITEFTISATDWRFPVTMVSVCVPFFIFIAVLQTKSGMEAFKQLGMLLETRLRGLGDGAQRRRERRRECRVQELQLLHAAAAAGPGGDGGDPQAKPPRRAPPKKKRRRLGRKGPPPAPAGARGASWLSWRRQRASEAARAEKDGNV